MSKRARRRRRQTPASAAARSAPAAAEQQGAPAADLHAEPVTPAADLRAKPASPAADLAAAPGSGAAAPGERQPSRRRAIGWGALLLGGLLAIFAAYVFYAGFPGRSTSLPLKDGVGRQIDKLLPQGWAFFTKDPQAVVYVPYRQSGPGGPWTSNLRGPLATPANGWGFDRYPRLQDQQIGSVVAGVDPRYWHACPPGVGLSSAQTCLAQDSVGVYATSPWPEPVLCGPVGVVDARPIPWTVARNGGPDFDATRVLIVDLRC